MIESADLELSEYEKRIGLIMEIVTTRMGIPVVSLGEEASKWVKVH